LLGFDLAPDQARSFEWYRRELLSWNERMNLTAITDPDEVEVKHFLDSLTCLLAMASPPQGRAVDIGSGAGFPGLALKIVHPRLHLTLVESIGKKVDFCRHIVQGLNLEGVEIIHDRVERVAHRKGYRQSYDWAFARAVAVVPILVEYMLPLLRLEGVGVIQKGERGPAEVHEAETALKILGGRVKRVASIELPKVAETRYLVTIEKTAATPEKYPRRPGIPAKRPLQ
jgi:16S rRNA (guanine527-N7)-methyltransferase